MTSSMENFLVSTSFSGSLLFTSLRCKEERSWGRGWPSLTAPLKVHYPEKLGQEMFVY